jgi:hypothetical protein
MVDAANYEAPTLDFGSYPSNEPASGGYAAEHGGDEFNDFEEDEMTRRIRE